MCPSPSKANLFPSPPVQPIEGQRTWTSKGGVMGTSIATIQAPCPLCGSPVLSIGRGGRVMSEDLHPILLGPDIG